MSLNLMGSRSSASIAATTCSTGLFCACISLAPCLRVRRFDCMFASPHARCLLCFLSFAEDPGARAHHCRTATYRTSGSVEKVTLKTLAMVGFRTTNSVRAGAAGRRRPFSRPFARDDREARLGGVVGEEAGQV